MKKLQTIGLLLLLAGIITGCGNNTNKTPTTVENGEDTKENQKTTEQEPLKGCYIGVLKRDTFQLAITAVNGNTVEGSLLYDFYEKDKAKGTIQGQFSNGLLLADYTFQSEGITSVRQVIFKKTATGFIEGYGNTKSEGGKDLLVDTAGVSYDNSLELKRSDICLP
ncbi:hypothetical protein [Desertivirga brevis]|uniref:hypothetical protein n=1 Tax=Desertivirga brevis TaxID=2810310 RepID=UPI001A966428|nr:hypothetical protein [Pedobacter sp. SYSU D00873]